MKKKNLITALAVIAVISLTACANSVDTTETTSSVSESTVTGTESSTETESSADGTSESETETTTESETESESESEKETSSESETETSETEKQTEPSPEEPTLPPVTEETKPTTTPEPTKPAVTTPATTVTPPATTTAPPTTTRPPETMSYEPAPTIVSVTGKVNGTHYIGDTLSNKDFTITVKLSNGVTLTNPTGFTVSPLKLTAKTNTLTVTYSGVKGTFTVNASEKPVVNPPANKYYTAEYPAVKTNQTKFSQEEIATRAYWELNVPYVANGKSHSGFDCSGLVWYAYHQSGIEIPASSAGQAKCGTKIPIYHVQTGDIVVYEYFNGSFHTGIYAGNLKVVDAMQWTPSQYSGVKIRHLYDDAITLNGLKRIYAVRVKGAYHGQSEPSFPSFMSKSNDALYGWNYSNAIQYGTHTALGIGDLYGWFDYGFLIEPTVGIQVFNYIPERFEGDTDITWITISEMKKAGYNPQLRLKSPSDYSDKYKWVYYSYEENLNK